MDMDQIKVEIKNIREQTKLECKKMYEDTKQKTSKVRELSKEKIAKLRIQVNELKENHSTKDLFLHTRIDKDLSDKLKAKTEKLGVSASDYIRTLVEKSLGN